MSEVILSAKNLYKSFNLDAGFFAKKDKQVFAVNDISFDLCKGETLGIVGESGCGKTTTARLLVRMYEPTSGSVLYYPSGKETLDVMRLSKKGLNEYRRSVKYVFQDPARSLNPRMTVLSVLTDAFKFSGKKIPKDELYSLAKKTIKEVGLNESDLERRPSEFSGGQRQRISIARALIMNPDVLICDEVVSALDVSIQGQILNLLKDLREEKKLSLIFITHDLKVASWFCDKIAVMYRGVMVEEARAEDLYKFARHPYTRLLFDGAQGRGGVDSVSVKTTLSREVECPFFHRCTRAGEKCGKSLPPLTELEDGQKVRCFY